MTEKQEAPEFTGIMLGFLGKKGDAQTYIGLSIGSERVALTLDQAAAVFDQLGNLLELAGVIQPEEEQFHIEGPKPCHH